MTIAQRLQVAAGILIDASGRVLITERLGDSPFAGLWEFPGGKLQGDETPAEAMVRELREELAVEVGDSEHFMHLLHEYADRSVELDFFLVHSWQREPIACDGQAMEWRFPADISVAELLPADGPVLEALLGRDRRV